MSAEDREQLGAGDADQSAVVYPGRLVADEHAHVVRPARRDDVGLGRGVGGLQVPLGTRGDRDPEAERAFRDALLVDGHLGGRVGQLEQSRRVEPGGSAAEHGDAVEPHDRALSFSILPSMSARRSFLDTFPTLVSGNSATTSSRSGSLNFARPWSSKNSPTPAT